LHLLTRNRRYQNLHFRWLIRCLTGHR